MKFLTSIDLNNNELLNVVIQVLSTEPKEAKMGQIYYNSTRKALYQFNGAVWTSVGASDVAYDEDTGTIIINGKQMIPVISINGKTGKYINLTAEDLGAISAKGTGLVNNLDLNNKKVIHLAEGIENTDAVNKKQLDDAIKALGTVFDFKGSVADTSKLPKEGNEKGDVWYVESDNSEYVYIDKKGQLGWELLGVTVDLTGYVTKTAADEKISKIISKTTKIMTTAESSVTIPYSGTLIDTYVVDTEGERVITEIQITESNVTFSIIGTPSTNLSCVVVFFNWSNFQ